MYLFFFLQNPRFRKSRQRQGKEGGGKGREKGRGRSRARPGLGATPDVCISVGLSEDLLAENL